jgi:antirestriction protein ArdC
MSRHPTRVRAGNDRASLYNEITDKIIAELEAGRIPWVQPWGTAAIKAPLAMPRNAASSADITRTTNAGAPRRLARSRAPSRFSSAFPSSTRISADFRIGGARAYYNTTGDFVQVPPPAAYFEPINWHRTAFHEFGHWTGHASRLDRDHSGLFGSKSYAREELVAEMAGAFVCASLGIVPTVRHADYIGTWLEVLREDTVTKVQPAAVYCRSIKITAAHSCCHRSKHRKGHCEV